MSHGPAWSCGGLLALARRAAERATIRLRLDLLIFEMRRKPTSFAPFRRRLITTLASLLLASGVVVAGPEPDVPTQVEQPSGIELTEYVPAWPGLEPYVARLRQGSRLDVKADLRRLVRTTASSDGALNLLAQLEREDSNLDEAELLIERAITSNPRQHLHHFQQAMIFFARLSHASGPLARWKWQRKTRDAYQKAFELNPRPVPYRYYLAYSYLQTPGIAGGDKDKALRLAQEGIDTGQREFYVVRADVYRLRGEIDPALADYDRAIAEKVFKLNSFLAAASLALERKDWQRAKTYSEWAVRCRPDSPRTHEGLGDYYAAVGDRRAATAAYETALGVDPDHSQAREKLVKLQRPK